MSICVTCELMQVIGLCSADLRSKDLTKTESEQNGYWSEEVHIRVRCYNCHSIPRLDTCLNECICKILNALSPMNIFLRRNDVECQALSHHTENVYCTGYSTLGWTNATLSGYICAARRMKSRGFYKSWVQDMGDKQTRPNAYQWMTTDRDIRIFPETIDSVSRGYTRWTRSETQGRNHDDSRQWEG